MKKKSVKKAAAAVVTLIRSKTGKTGSTVQSNEESKTLETYGLGPGFLTYHKASKRWDIFFDYASTVVNVNLSKKNGNERIFLDEIETLHVASMEGELRKRWVSFPSIAPARRVIRTAVVQAIKNLDATNIQAIADAINALQDLNSRDRENEQIILSIIQCARAISRVPFIGEVREYHNDKYNRHFNETAWNYRLKRVGFSWLPRGRRGKCSNVSKIELKV